jgi:hypothetical protein
MALIRLMALRWWLLLKRAGTVAGTERGTEIAAVASTEDRHAKPECELGFWINVAIIIIVVTNDQNSAIDIGIGQCARE